MAGITGREFKSRLGFILLAFFAFYLIEPVKEWINSNFQINPLIIGVVGIILTLYFFDF